MDAVVKMIKEGLYRACIREAEAFLGEDACHVLTYDSYDGSVMVSHFTGGLIMRAYLYPDENKPWQGVMWGKGKASHPERHHGSKFPKITVNTTSLVELLRWALDLPTS